MKNRKCNESNRELGDVRRQKTKNLVIKFDFKIRRRLSLIAKKSKGLVKTKQ